MLRYQPTPALADVNSGPNRTFALTAANGRSEPIVLKNSEIQIS
jgi:hypothetical protein